MSTKRDGAIYREAKEYLRHRYRGMPEKHAHCIARAISGRAWGDLEIAKIVAIRVTGYVKHELTDYDRLRDGGMTKKAAMALIRPETQTLINSWYWGPPPKPMLDRIWSATLETAPKTEYVDSNAISVVSSGIAGELCPGPEQYQPVAFVECDVRLSKAPPKGSEAVVGLRHIRLKFLSLWQRACINALRSVMKLPRPRDSGKAIWRFTNSRERSAMALTVARFAWDPAMVGEENTKS